MLPCPEATTRDDGRHASEARHSQGRPLSDPHAPVLSDENVPRLEVAMDDASFVRVLGVDRGFELVDGRRALGLQIGVAEREPRRDQHLPGEVLEVGRAERGDGRAEAGLRRGESPGLVRVPRLRSSAVRTKDQALLRTKD